jgi:DNA replication licensing factor MCM6
VADYAIARHITALHRDLDEALAPPFTSEDVQLYLRFARTLKPAISPEAAKVGVVAFFVVFLNFVCGARW